ncbi:MAG: hypothetical protein WC376_03415 [Candidatus Nanoarchaeia archaeon]|jgi:hypothetical protein
MNNLEKKLENIKYDEICLNFGISKSKRLKEMQDFGNDEACIKYKKSGCYSCDGHNKECSNYYSSKSSYDSKKKLI